MGNRDELNNLSAKILVQFFGWRWMKGIRSNCISLHPPANDFFDLAVCNFDETPGYYLDVTANEHQYSRFQDWYRSFCLSSRPSENAVLPPFATDRNYIVYLLDRMEEMKILEAFLMVLALHLSLHEKVNCSDIPNMILAILRFSPKIICELAIKFEPIIKGMSNVGG